MSVINSFFSIVAPYFERIQKNRDFLLEMVPKGSVCAEVGVWKGDFSKKILKRVKPKKLHLIDPWLFMPTYQNRWYGGSVAKGQSDMDRIYQNVKLLFKDDDEVIIHRSFSDKAVNKFEDNYFDFVYIDADHSYKFVKEDLASYFNKVKKGGIIAGDDHISLWSILNGFPVKKAVDEFKNSGVVRPIYLRGQFVFQKL